MESLYRYKFTDGILLLIVSNDLEVAPNPDPPIYNSMNIIIAIPEVSINPSTNENYLLTTTFDINLYY